MSRKPGPWSSSSVSIILGDVEYEAEVEWFGTYSRATRSSPEEFPEPLLVSCKRDGLDYPLDSLTVEAEEKLMARACDSAEEDEDEPDDRTYEDIDPCERQRTYKDDVERRFGKGEKV
jgi:hypothetical protein